MTIQPDLAIGAELPVQTFEWDPADVLRYHLSLGAGADATSVDELRYVYERDLMVLPTFGMTSPAVFGIAAPNRYWDEPPEIRYPGVEIDLAGLLHASQELVIHQPLPVSGSACARTRITDIYDKVSAAIVVHETVVSGADVEPLFTARSSMYVWGEGGFHGHRGPSRSSKTSGLLDRRPDVTVDTSTLPQQALLYRIWGDRHPLHVDPDAARAAGFSRPILQGACVYGMVCKALVDAVLAGDVSRIYRYAARFAGVAFPGETLRTSVWGDGDDLAFTTSAVERPSSVVLAGGVLTTR